jgi:hypothetical protein
VSKYLEQMSNSDLDNLKAYLKVLDRVFGGSPNPHDLQVLETLTGQKLNYDSFSVEYHRLFMKDIPLWHGFYKREDGLVGGYEEESLITVFNNLGVQGSAVFGYDHFSSLLSALSTSIDKKDMKSYAILMQYIDEMGSYILKASEKAKSYLFQIIMLSIEKCLKLEWANDEGAATQKVSGTILEISAKLCRPVSAEGLDINPFLIKQCAAEEDIKIGFGTRQQLIENLLTSAYKEDKLGRICDRLGVEIEIQS